MLGMHRFTLLILIFTFLVHSAVSENENESQNSKSKSQENLDFIKIHSDVVNSGNDEDLNSGTEAREENEISEEPTPQTVEELYEEVKRKHEEAYDIGQQVELLKKKLDLLKNFDKGPHSSISTSSMIDQLKEIVLTAKKLKERNDKILESSFTKSSDSGESKMDIGDKTTNFDDPRAFYEHLKQQLPQKDREYIESLEPKGWKDGTSSTIREQSNKIPGEMSPPPMEDFFSELKKKNKEAYDAAEQMELLKKKLDLLKELEKGSLEPGSSTGNLIRPAIEQLKKVILSVKEFKEQNDKFVAEGKKNERLTNDPRILNELIKQQAETLRDSQRDRNFNGFDRKSFDDGVSSAGDRKTEDELRDFLNFEKIVVEEPVVELTEEEKLGLENYEKAQALLSERKPDYATAYNLLEIASTLGNVKAKLHIAWSKLFGTHLAQNIPEAVEKFTEMAAKNIPDAQMGLGFLHAAGIGVRADQGKALVYYTFAAISGSTWARMALAYRYFAGATVQNSCERALDFYRLVANEVAKEVSLSGGPMVQRIRLLEEAENSGYNTGIIENDLVEYYQLLAEKGDVKAQVGLGQLHYQGGRGVPLDVQKALQYFIPAADAGNPIAMAFLGKIYLEGHGNAIKQDNQTAYKYFKKAADLNNPVGQAGLGLMYLEGRGVEKDYGKAHRYFSQAADQGWVDGQLQLGVMYFNGLGARRDYKLANKYFSHASQSGHVLAFYNLAQMHATGTGVMRSCSTAVELYKNVAERGKWGEKLMIAHTMYREGYINEAYVIYAFMAELGYEVAQSNAAFLLDKQEVSLWEDEKNMYVRALMYWGRAAGQGYSAAIVKLGDYHYYGLGTNVDYEVAAMHYRLASDQQHNAQAMFNLGYMHEQGLGMTKDIYLAKRCYDMAAETSADAKIPVALALAKLSILFSLKYFEDVKWFNWLFFLDLHHMLGPYWDLYLGTFLIGLLGIIFYYRRFLPH